MTTVQQLLDAKGREIHSVHPDDTVLDALKIMEFKNVGGVLVIEGDALVGIFTERDYARDVFLKGRASPKTPIREVMKTNLICVTPDETVEACMVLMTDKHIRHLPVLENEQLVGLISIGDIVKSIIDDQKHTIEQLQSFIRS